MPGRFITEVLLVVIYEYCQLNWLLATKQRVVPKYRFDLMAVFMLEMLKSSRRI